MYHKNNKHWIVVLGLFLLNPLWVFSQLCTGSLGEPIVNLDFGSGSSVHGNPLGTAITSYTWSSANFPSDGYYTIESTTNTPNTWWTTTDHTGGGYMMVVNASFSVSDYFYKNTITGLCPQTTYEFSAWVMNLLKKTDNSLPNITFSIESTSGTILNSYNTGDIALQSGPVWKQYGFYFTTPANVSTVIIRMRNNKVGAAPGNDIALDDISLRACGPLAQASVNGSTTVTLCANALNTFLLSGTVSSGYANPSYQWQISTGTTWTDIPGATSINYTYTLAADAVSEQLRFRLTAAEGSNISSMTCRVLSNEVSVQIEASPVASYEIASVACLNQKTQFTDLSISSSALSYYWIFGDGTTGTGENPAHVYTDTGMFQTALIVTSANGCIDTADNSLAVTVYPIPTASFSAYPMDTTIFYPEVTINDNSTDAIWCSIDWGDGTVTDCAENTHTYAKYGKYAIVQTVANSSGCTDTALVTIIKRPEFRFFVPNAFTPDGDGFNEEFIPKGLGWEEYTLRIFNRWGQKIFETSDTDKTWDGKMNGKDAPIGVYVYQITFRDAVEYKLYEYRGSLTLLR